MRPTTLLLTPMCHRGVHVGSFFLGEKAGEEAFTEEDQEVLVLLASQAGAGIANARTHRGKRRVRADLKALVDTSPDCVVVFDATTRRPVKFNREARRIVVQAPNGSPLWPALDTAGRFVQH